MHELAIATSIVSIATKEIEKLNFPKVRIVAVRIGALSGIVPDALEFSFDAIKTGTPLHHSTLQIEEIPLQGKCRACSHEFRITGLVFVCPECQSGQVEVIRGDELEIAYLELED